MQCNQPRLRWRRSLRGLAGAGATVVLVSACPLAARAQAPTPTASAGDMWDAEGLPGRGPNRGAFMAEGPGALLPLLIRRSDLTPDQQTRIRTIVAANHRSLRALFDALRTAQDDLVGKLLAPGPLDAKDLAAQTDRIVQLRQQLMQQGLTTALAVRAVLTPEQLAKAAQTKDRLQKLRAEMRGLMEDE